MNLATAPQAILFVFLFEILLYCTVYIHPYPIALTAEYLRLLSLSY